MRGILTGLGVLSSLASAIEATQHDGIISYPLKATTARNISKRQIEIGVENGLDGVLYTIDISVGTPGQTVAVQVDTGSEELWVNPECASSIDPAFCQSTGRFTQSTTLVDLITRGGKQYPLGNAEWEYGLDYVGVGSALLEGQIFGVADDTSGLPAGVLGLAPALSGWNSPYPLVLDNMAAQGYISSRAFSLDLRHAGAQDGVVIFGGIDTARYIGPLERLPIIPANQSPDGFTRYWVSASSIAVSRQGKNDVIVSGTARAFTLDTSYSLTGLPSPLFEAFIQAFPTAAPASGTNQYTVDCYALQVIGAIRFTFGNTVISIPYRDFISQKGNTCYLDVIRSDSLPVLGINFLRAAYVVFDLDNREILMANSAINDCGSNLVRIGSGPGAVPSIVGTCAGTSSFTTPISTSTSTPTSTGASTSAVTSTSTYSGISTPATTYTSTSVSTNSTSISRGSSSFTLVSSGSRNATTPVLTSTSTCIFNGSSTAISTTSLSRSRNSSLITSISSTSFNKSTSVPRSTSTCTVTIFPTTTSANYISTLSTRSNQPNITGSSSVTSLITNTTTFNCSSRAQVTTQIIAQNGSPTTATYTLPGSRTRTGHTVQPGPQVIKVIPASTRPVPSIIHGPSQEANAFTSSPNRLYVPPQRTGFPPKAAVTGVPEPFETQIRHKSVKVAIGAPTEPSSTDSYNGPMVAGASIHHALSLLGMGVIMLVTLFL